MKRLDTNNTPFFLISDEKRCVILATDRELHSRKLGYVLRSNDNSDELSSGSTRSSKTRTTITARRARASRLVGGLYVSPRNRAPKRPILGCITF